MSYLLMTLIILNGAWGAPHTVEPTYRYAVCDGYNVRYYDGDAGYVRYGRAVGIAQWTDYQVPWLPVAALEQVDGCTIGTYSTYWHEHYLSSYRPASNSWSFPEIVLPYRALLPLVAGGTP